MAKHSLIQRVQSYQDYYAAGDSHTARAKRLDISHFLDFLVTYRGYATRVKLTIHDWDKSSVERFVETKLLNGEAPSTVARRLATLKHMGRTLSEQIKDFKNPAKEVRAPKQSPLKPHSVSADELDEIKDYAEGRIVQRNGAFNRIRNRMLLLLLVDTGIRAEEARLLTRGQLTEDLEWLTNVRTKARRYRNVYITSEIRSDLADYLRHRAVELTRFYPRLPVTADNKLPFFISNYKASADDPNSFRMGAKSVWRAVNELSTETHLHPHILRHSYAIDLLESSKDVRLVAQALGHSDVKVTMRYTEQNDKAVILALERSRKNKGTKKTKLLGDQSEEKGT